VSARRSRWRRCTEPGRRTAAGLGLIDLVVGLMLAGLLIALALPSFTEPLATARRHAVVALMWQAQQHLLDHQASNGSLTGAVLPEALTRWPADGPVRYRIDLTVAPDGRGHLLTATPQGPSADDRCGTLWLDHTGRHGQDAQSGQPACWP
jgi:type IV pilus assembly protein PilE